MCVFAVLALRYQINQNSHRAHILTHIKLINMPSCTLHNDLPHFLSEGDEDMTLSKLWEIVKGTEACRATVHGLAKSQTWLRDWATKTTWRWGIFRRAGLAQICCLPSHKGYTISFLNTNHLGRCELSPVQFCKDKSSRADNIHGTNSPEEGSTVWGPSDWEFDRAGFNGWFC